jgi:TrmH family RNA methyltransferase
VPATLINSLQNPKVKYWRKFQKNHFRRESELFVVEGLKECVRGIQSEFQLEELLLCPEILDKSLEDISSKIQQQETSLFHVSPQIYSKLAYRGETEGILGLFRKKDRNLSQFPPLQDANNLYLIVDNAEKPGNLGAILRTADAVGARGVILSGGRADPYNPNVVRSSLGTFFNVPVIQSTQEEIEAWAKVNDIPIFCAALPAYADFYSLDFDNTVAFAFGTEHDGLSEPWLKDRSRNFTLPMHGIADSLNLSVSVAVVAYEYLRRYPLS